MKISKAVIVILLASFIGNFFIYPFLPEIIPIHWSIGGTINGTGSKNFIFLLGILPILIYMFLYLTSKFDARIKSGKMSLKTYSIMTMIPVLILIIINWGLNISVLNPQINMKWFLTAIMASTGIGFVVLGIYLARLKQNNVFGIRIRWTLSNEQVWEKTHRFGGRGFIIIGLIVLALSFIKISASIIAMITLLITFSILIIIYSYIQYKNIAKLP